MSTNLPQDFFSWKSFQSLSQVAAMAWITTLIIDVIFLQRIDDPFDQLRWLWMCGLAICLLLSFIRYYFKENKEKGDKALLVLNALLIFLYASGFNGFTKELGSWSEVQTSMHEIIPQDAAIEQLVPAAIIAFVSPVLKNQTAFWPDVQRIQENNALRSENSGLHVRVKELEESLAGPQYIEKDMLRLKKENEALKQRLKECLKKAGGKTVDPDKVFDPINPGMLDPTHGNQNPVQ